MKKNILLMILSVLTVSQLNAGLWQDFKNGFNSVWTSVFGPKRQAVERETGYAAQTKPAKLEAESEAATAESEVGSIGDKSKEVVSTDELSKKIAPSQEEALLTTKEEAEPVEKEAVVETNPAVSKEVGYINEATTQEVAPQPVVAEEPAIVEDVAVETETVPVVSDAATKVADTIAAAVNALTSAVGLESSAKTEDQIAQPDEKTGEMEKPVAETEQGVNASDEVPASQEVPAMPSVDAEKMPTAPEIGA